MAAKKKKQVDIRSSAAEYLTYVASSGTGSVEIRYEDEKHLADTEIAGGALWRRRAYDQLPHQKDFCRQRTAIQLSQFQKSLAE